MDNKLTKKRLADFFMYHWITLICVMLAVVCVWEIVYSMFSVSLTAGQKFKYFYDENLTYINEDGFEKIISDSKPFSYDVIEHGYEILGAEYNVLNARLIVKDGDVIFTDNFMGEKGDKESRAKNVVDGENVISYEKLLQSAKTYLVGFLKSEFNSLSTLEKEEKALDYDNFNENFDQTKITQNFLARNANDNRFRKSADKERGAKDEIARIKNLVKETASFNYLLNYAPEELFFRYTKFEQAVFFADKNVLEFHKANLKREQENGRANVIYGLNVFALKGEKPKKEVKNYFRINEFSSSDHVVLMAFNFLSEQPDLQFETISFINMVVRNFSNFYDEIE